LCTLSAEEFIRRFLQHVLPKGFVKVRYFDFFAAWLQLVSMQERSTQTALLPRFSLVLVGFLDIQSIQRSNM